MSRVRIPSPAVSPPRLQGGHLTSKDVLKHDFAQVPGLGDEAWIEDGTVFVQVGDLWFSLHLISDADASVTRPKLEAVAKTIIGRLGG